MVPLDILGLIFAEYGKQETLDSPLETLLLVCKEWRNLCLDLKILWSSFNITFGTGIEAKKWADLVPKRLARSESSTPIHVVIMNNRKQAHQYRNLETGGREHHRCPALVGHPIFDPEMPCSCDYDVPEHITSILESLAGREGQMCHRWVTLCLSLHTRGRRMHLLKPLTYPTPNLRTLTLQGVDSSWIGARHTLFPSTPSLSSLSLQHSNIPHIHAGPGGLLQTAHHLKRLELHDYSISTVTFPAVLPALKTLVIRGNWHGASSRIEVPKLTSLTREMTSLNLNKPYDCFIIPFENLDTLGIFYHGRLPLPTAESAFTAALIKLLTNANNVKTIAGDEYSIMTLLLILSNPHPPTGLGLTTNQLKICMTDRRNAGRIEWALESGDSIFTLNMGEHLASDIDYVREKKGWAGREVVLPTRPQPTAP